MSFVTPLLISGLDGNYLDVTVPSPLTLLIASFTSPDPSTDAGSLPQSGSFPDVDARSPLARLIASWDPHYVEPGVPTSPEKVFRGRVCSRAVDNPAFAPCSPRVQERSFERKVSDASISASPSPARTVSDGPSVSTTSTSCSSTTSAQTGLESVFKTSAVSSCHAKSGWNARNPFSRFWKAVTRTRI